MKLAHSEMMTFSVVELVLPGTMTPAAVYLQLLNKFYICKTTLLLLQRLEFFLLLKKAGANLFRLTI